MLVNDPQLIVKSIRDGGYVNIRTSGGWNPLMHASATGNFSLARELLSLGANVNHVENDGWSALHFATFEGSADHTMKTSNGNTALDIARSEKHEDIITILSSRAEMNQLEDL
jgi:ankyrin repeat protein